MTDRQRDIICICNYHGRGGAQNNAARIARGFERRGYSCRLVFLFEREPDVEFPGAIDVKVIAQRKTRSLKSALAMFKSLYRTIHMAEPKAVFGFFPMSNVVGALFSGRAKMIGTLRNPAFIPKEGGDSSTKRSQSRFAGGLDKIFGATPLYDRIIAVSDVVRRSFDGYPASYRKKITVIHNSTPQLPPVDESKSECRAVLNLPQDAKIIGMLGRLHKQKNISFALDVIAKVEDASVLLVLAGDGPDREDLKGKATRLGIRDRVIFTGMLSGSDVTRFYRAIDLFAFPSIFEGFGLTQIEAMSQQCPVLANDIAIMAEVGGDGAVRLPLDALLWARTAERLLNDMQARTDLISRGLERAAFFHDEERMIDRYLEAAKLPPFKAKAAHIG